jgi:hypothetical protein
MSPGQAGAGGDERDDELTGEPGAAPQLPQQDTTGVAGYAAGTGPQRRAGAEVLQRASRGATADGGRAWPGLLPPEGHGGQDGTGSRPGPASAGQRISRPTAVRLASLAGSRDAAGVAARPYGVS